MRPLGFAGSSAMNSAQEKSVCCGSGAWSVVALAIPVDRGRLLAVGVVAVRQHQLDRRPDAACVVAVAIGSVAVDRDRLRLDLHQLPAVVY